MIGINDKPREQLRAASQGGHKSSNNNSTTLKESKSRHDKGMELYKEGKVKLSSNGLFKVSGYYEVDTERMVCTCPDYRTRKESCKHLFAAMLFVKNRGKQTIEHLEGNGKNQSSTGGTASEKPTEVKENLPTGGNVSKSFDRQSTITRLAVLNTATEILKTHRKPIEFSDIVSLAAELEKWALGS